MCVYTYIYINICIYTHSICSRVRSPPARQAMVMLPLSPLTDTLWLVAISSLCAEGTEAGTGNIYIVILEEMKYGNVKTSEAKLEYV